MRQAFAILGLDSGATLVEIKKAYARLLKQTRPEDDAVGFQKLQEAYEACIRYTKQNAARAEARLRVRELAPAGVDEEAEGEGEEAEETIARGGELPELAPVRSRVVPVAPPPPMRTPPRAPLPPAPPPLASPPPSPPPVRQRAPLLPEPELLALLEQIVAEGERLGDFALRKWLHAHDALVSLDMQRLLATRLPAFILERKPQLNPENLRVIFEYFIGSEYNPAHADPRLRMAWEQVHADDVYRRGLAALRRRHYRYFDRLAFDELLAAPQTWRRRLLLATPTMVGRITRLLAEIRGLDANRAEQALQPEAVAFWSALGAPGRLPWRLVALVHAQMAAIILLIIGGIGAMEGLDFVGFLGMSAGFLAEASVVWFAMKGLGLIRYYLAMRRQKQLAAGIKPRDSLLSTGYVMSAIALAFAGWQVFEPADGGPVAYSVIFAAIALAILWLSGRGKRWEMPVLGALAAACIWTLLAILLGKWLAPPAQFALAASFGALCATLADEWHARREKLDPARARLEINHIALKLAGLFLVVLLVAAKFGTAQTLDPQSAAAQSQKREVEVRSLAAASTQDRIQDAIAQMQRESRPWTLWAERTNTSELPKFGFVDDAFQTLLQAATPQEPSDSPFRAFHIPDGPLAGDWIFSGGDRNGPDFMVHYLLANAVGVRETGQMLCRKQDRACRQFRKAAGQAPAELERDANRLNGGRLTWDSPGAPPASFTCPDAELTPVERAMLSADSIRVRLLFNGRGEVIDTQLPQSGENPATISAALTASAHCQITPANSEPGILETTIVLR